MLTMALHHKPDPHPNTDFICHSRSYLSTLTLKLKLTLAYILTQPPTLTPPLKLTSASLTTDFSSHMRHILSMQARLLIN